VVGEKGWDGAMLHTTDGGVSWSTATTAEPLRWVEFHDHDCGWAVGNAGTMMRTTDGGAVWATVDPGTSTHLRAVSFLDNDHGWAVGVDGTILYSTDGGAGWLAQPAATSIDFVSVAAIAPGVAWAAGDNGYLLRLSPRDESLPITTSAGVAGAWVNEPPTIVLQSDDPAGVAVFHWSLTAPSGTTTGCGARVPVTDEGSSTISAQAVDNAGNAGPSATTTVGLDTLKPTPTAPRRASVARGRVATLWFRVADPRPGSPTATVTIKVKNRAGAVVKKRVLKSQRVNADHSCRFRCTLPKGKYRFYVYAKDTAGNTQTEVANNRLVVR
jgi:hypothetical protein